MRIIDCDQRSSKWFKVRCGIPTGSGLANIVTPKGKPTASTKRNTYLNELLWERMTGKTFERYESYAMKRGVELEPKAVEYFEMMHDCKVIHVGFCLHDDGICGVSPDGFIGDNAGIEIKTARPANYVQKLRDNCIPSDNIIQIQANMWITGRDKWHFLLYDDVLPEFEDVARPDDDVIKALDKYVPEFVKELNEAESVLRKRLALVDRKNIDIDKLSGDWCPFK